MGRFPPQRRQAQLAALLVALCVGHAAAADEATGPLTAGTICTEPSGVSVKLPDVRFLVTRGDIDSANAAFEAERLLLKRVNKLADDNRKLIASSVEPTWRVALRWALTGAAVGAAFALGAAL